MEWAFVCLYLYHLIHAVMNGCLYDQNLLCTSCLKHRNNERNNVSANIYLGAVSDLLRMIYIYTLQIYRMQIIGGFWIEAFDHPDLQLYPKLWQIHGSESGMWSSSPHIVCSSV